MTDAHVETVEPLEPIVIYATRGFDGYTFALEMHDREWIVQQTHGQIAPARRVSIALDTKADFEATFGAIEPQVVTLLTGMNPERLQRLGGIEVRDSKTDQVMWSSQSASAA